MKTLLLSLTATVAILASTYAQAASDLIPSFKGKINNYTSIPTESLIVRVDLDCSYSSGFVWPESKTCGSQVLEIAVAADGTYVVPAMKYQKKSGIKNYRFSHSIRTEAMYPESLTFDFFYAKDIHAAPKRLAEVSIYEMPTLNINAVTPTGENYASWRGTKPCVELIFLLKMDQKYQVNGREMRESATDKAVAGKIPSIYFSTLGNPGANLPLEGSLYYRTSKPECLVNQDTVKFENAVVATGTLSELHKLFNNSSYKVD